VYDDNTDDLQSKDEEERAGESNDAVDNIGGDNVDDVPSTGGNSSGSSGSKAGRTIADTGDARTERREADEVPNPMKNPGEASKFWHTKLNMVENSGLDEAKEAGMDDGDDDDRGNGDYEYVKENQEGTTQALGETEEKDAKQLESMDEEVIDKRAEIKNNNNTQSDPPTSERSRSQTKRRSNATLTDPDADVELEDDTNDKDESAANTDDKVDDAHGLDSECIDVETGNQVTSDLSQLRVEDDSMDMDYYGKPVLQEEQAIQVSSDESDAARARWSAIQSDTHNLSRRLCEKLRLVMEPLVASKLRGDYRTGKRINMKRVIGFIASGYRKDKIWLRRTKPAKRNYRVLVAVDDSESMLKSGAGEMALKAMATLAVGMSQLEVGEVGVASFGNEMNLVHPFHMPFTSESGPHIVGSFQFDQQRTRTALCVESAMMALSEAQGDCASMQLVFMISDGRIERDSRAVIRRLVREMIERNILLVLIIVEGTENKKDSIINMKEVSFEKGKPKVRQFIDDFPFPYYIVLSDMQTLPEVLGDALRQWFEMLARLQTSAT
jgi:midasin